MLKTKIRNIFVILLFDHQITFTSVKFGLSNDLLSLKSIQLFTLLFYASFCISRVVS